MAMRMSAPPNPPVITGTQAKQARRGEPTTRLFRETCSSTAVTDVGVEGRASPRGRRLAGRALFLLVSLISLYLLLPSLLAVFVSWRELFELAPEWIAMAFVLEALSFTAIWQLQRLALGPVGERLGRDTRQAPLRGFESGPGLWKPLETSGCKPRRMPGRLRLSFAPLVQQRIGGSVDTSQIESTRVASVEAVRGVVDRSPRRSGSCPR